MKAPGHTYDPTGDLSCRSCGLSHKAHVALPDHPEEAKLRTQEVDAAATLGRLSRKTARALREHRRVDSLVLLAQLEVVTDNLRKAMLVAISDQMGVEGDG